MSSPRGTAGELHRQLLMLYHQDVVDTQAIWQVVREQGRHHLQTMSQEADVTFRLVSRKSRVRSESFLAFRASLRSSRQAQDCVPRCLISCVSSITCSLACVTKPDVMQAVANAAWQAARRRLGSLSHMLPHQTVTTPCQADPEGLAIKEDAMRNVFSHRGQGDSGERVLRSLARSASQTDRTKALAHLATYDASFSAAEVAALIHVVRLFIALTVTVSCRQQSHVPSLLQVCTVLIRS